MTVQNHLTSPASVYQQIYESDEFVELKRRRRGFVLPISILFITWYASYVGLACYAPQFMAVKVIGNITVALVAGILQILSTLVLATLYVRFTNREIDPEAAHVRRMVEQARRGESEQKLFGGNR
ncbi:hypothetical protein GCM10023321_13170 [Pseudonocardia eucalypti]|uniref:DUF485 domain-containing protein n=1 Tax=Pseudonocardia eucalypti TaxID=648755 RepID=A0ABP9PN66_9PSEU|nr:uncharacterized membrane protein (DUF485 family) [Pseudonocardia eucalypti]